MKINSCLAALIVIALPLLCGSTSAFGQTTITITYPLATATLTTGTIVTVTGSVVSMNTQNLAAIQVQITDSANNVYIGTGGINNNSLPPSFSIAVNIPATAAVGAATCTVSGSTTGRTPYNVGTTTTNPTIVGPPPPPPPGGPGG